MILGVDVGGRRVGVAVASPETRVATPLEIIDARTTDPVARILDLVRQRDVTSIVVGVPTGLAGRAGPAVEAQREFVDALRRATTVPVEEYDERFTTVLAERGLRAAGASRGGRKTVRDAVAAQVILQGYLDRSG